MRLGDGTDVPCRVKGNFRIKGIRTTNPVAVGDRALEDFRREAAALGMAPRAVAQVPGFNYTRGRALALHLFQKD